MADTIRTRTHRTGKLADSWLWVSKRLSKKGERDVRYPAARRVRWCAEWPLSFRLGF
jgi:hypothetical protein